MTSFDWHRIESLFIEALAIPEEEREQFLTSAKAGQIELDRVRSMLRVHGDINDFLEPPAELAGSLNIPAARALPARIGDYQIIRQIAAGGMGVVYEALQDNPHRTVALKVIRAGLFSEEQLRRLRLETRALARMQHPGIAQIYSAGMHEQGGWSIPYFAMELVAEALPITEFAQTHGLSIDARLALVAKVCEAVHHGHQRSVIHRDLKPSNILIAPGGQPKVIDFGVARITDPDSAATLQTFAGDLIGTLAYMSPEQCTHAPRPARTLQSSPSSQPKSSAGDNGTSDSASPDLLDIDIRTDVYSLGIVLYELLTGALPYPVQTSPLTEAVRLICEAVPERPTANNPALSRDIETIILKSIEKDRTRRYQSAAEFAADIWRYLGRQPIEARPPTLGYQLGLLAKRNRTVVAAAAAIALALVAATGISLNFAFETRRAAAAEMTERARKTVIADFLRLTFTSADPQNAMGREISVKDLLDEASARLQASPSNLADADAEIHEIVGVTYRALGLLSASEPHLRRAHLLRNHMFGANHPETLRAAIELGVLLRHQSKFDEAEPLVRHAYSQNLAKFGVAHSETLGALNTLALLEGDRGRIQEAASLLRAGHEHAHVVLGPAHHVTMSMTNNLASIAENLGDWEEAERHYRDSLSQRIVVYGEEHPRTLVALNNLGLLLVRMGRNQEAASILESALEARSRILGDEHPGTLSTANNYALVLRNLGRHGETEALYRRILDARLRTLGEGHQSTWLSMHNLALALQRDGKSAEAESMLEHAFKLSLTHTGPGHSSTLTLQESLAGIIYETGRYEESEARFRELLAAASAVFPASDWRIAQISTKLASCLLRQDELDEAEPLLLSAHEAYLQTYPATHPRVRSNISLLGTLYEAQGDMDRAMHFRSMLRTQADDQ